MKKNGRYCFFEHVIFGATLSGGARSALHPEMATDKGPTILHGTVPLRPLSLPGFHTIIENNRYRALTIIINI